MNYMNISLIIILG